MATKYVSSLTGPEMDAALIDMTYHNSEAYAVGTRNGVEVGSGDVTYHNNSKYYAEQVYGYTDRAEDAAARAEAAVPAGTAGAVFFDRAQSLTTAQQSQARANIMAGGSNDNLLDNAYFVGGGSQLGDGIFPINQRGKTSYSNGTNTTIDRWKTEASSISVDADGLTWTATGDNNQFEQIIENYKLIEGETYTATIDCDISAGSARLFVGGVSSPWPTVAGSTVYVSSGITKVTFTFARESGYTGQYKLALASVGSCTAKLRKFKLEKGTVSTLANDPPPDFGEELRKCQRYLRYVSLKRLPVFCDANYLIAMTTLEGIEMRATPTPSLVSAGYIFNPANSATSVPTAVSILAFEYNTATIQLPIPASFNGFCMAVDSAICLSAEL